MQDLIPNVECKSKMLMDLTQLCFIFIPFGFAKCELYYIKTCSNTYTILY